MRLKPAPPYSLPPLIYPGRTSAERKEIARLKAEGAIRPIGPKLFTSLPHTTPKSELENFVRTAWSQIVSRLFPGALIAYQTALTFKPSDDGEVFLLSNTNRRVVFPGLELVFMRGPGALDDDPEFIGARVSSTARALLENLQTAKGGLSTRALPKKDVEAFLEEHLSARGEEAFNLLRDQARKVSRRLRLEKEFAKLDLIMSAMLGTKSERNLSQPKAVARSLGLPFDGACFARLESLFSYLKRTPMTEIKETNKSPDHFRNKAFFESYFSNFIEGTVFEVNEAEQIVYDRKIPSARPIEAHDILGTYKIVSDPNEMRDLPQNVTTLESILKRRHAILLEKRPDVQPGQFKTINNQAGSSAFVRPELLPGTFEKGMEFYLSLERGFARAAFIMFLVAEAHPFNDGNGRVARIMMNAELMHSGLSTIIIPNVFREDYITGLKGLTKRQNPEPFVRTLAAAHDFSSIDFSDYVRVKDELTARNWFSDPREAIIVRR